MRKALVLVLLCLMAALAAGELIYTPVYQRDSGHYTADLDQNARPPTMAESMYTSAVLWLSLNQTTNSYGRDELPDLSTSGNHATFPGGSADPVFTNVGGGAYDFDGTDDFLRVAAASSLDFTDGAGNDEPFSVSAWVNMDDASVFVIATRRSFATHKGLTLLVSASDLPYFFCSSTQGVYIGRGAPAVTADEGTWLSIIGTYSGNNANSGFDIYLDGVVSDNADFSAGSYGGLPAVGANPLDIGVRRAGGDSFADGRIDELMIFDRALTAAEVTNLVNVTAPAKYPSFDASRSPFHVYDDSVLDLRFTTDGDTNDYSANGGNDAALPGGSSDPSWSNTAGGCYAFDGTDDYLQVADDDSLTFGNGASDSPYSISAWVYLREEIGTFRSILAKNSTTKAEYAFAIHGDGTLRLYNYDDVSSNNRIRKSSSTVPTNQWVFVCGTGDGTYAGMTLYINGVGESVAHQESGYTAMENEAVNIVVGGTASDSPSSIFKGLIDEPTIYNRALTAAEVTNLYNAGVGDHQ